MDLPAAMLVLGANVKASLSPWPAASVSMKSPILTAAAAPVYDIETYVHLDWGYSFTTTGPIPALVSAIRPPCIVTLCKRTQSY